MAFHFVGFSYTGPFHRFGDFEIDIPGGGVPFPLDIVVYTQPTDRYSVAKGVPPSAVICLVGPQLSILPIDYDGFIIERSDNAVTWIDVSGLIRESFFYVDTPPSSGVYFYRAKMRVASGLTSTPGIEVQTTIGQWEEVDELGITEINAPDGANIIRIPRGIAFPNGFDDDAQEGMSISEGSMAGGFGKGVWYVRSREFDPPIVYGFTPACSTIGVLLPLNQILYKLQDKPYPTGGSGIDDSYTTITLAVSSQYSGAPILVRQGMTQPASPIVTCSVLPGADPVLDRNVIIAFAPTYVSQGDTVEVTTYVRDLDGNETVHVCIFEMEARDDEEPEIISESPECGLGIESADTRRASRDTDFSFRITDNDSGVNQSTIDVFYGPASIGPWTQVLNNGVTFLGGFSGSVASNTSNGFDVTIRRPSSSPTWPAGSQVCFRILVEDNEGNAAEEICCFRVEDEAGLGRVIPIAEDILYVEFSIEMTNDPQLRDPRNYTITLVDPDLESILVKQVFPQNFLPPADDRTPGTEYGDGSPFFVYLGTSPHTAWGVYQLEVNGDNIRDRYELPMSSTERTAEYRGRRTKVDDGRDDIGGFVARENSNVRKLLTSIMHSDEQVGGVFFDDDWE